jgi:hypothetical protein
MPLRVEGSDFGYPLIGDLASDDGIISANVLEKLAITTREGKNVGRFKV